MVTVAQPPPDVTVEAGARRRRRWYRRPRWIIAMAVVAVSAVGGVAVFGVLWSERGAEEVGLDDAVGDFRSGGPGGSGATGGVAGGGSGDLVPEPGVYAYEARGTERLSVLGTSQEWGATIPGTVTHDGACWTMRLDYSTNHWQSWDYCPEDGVLREVGGHAFQSFDFVAFTVDEDVVFACDPPGVPLRVDAEPGDSWDQQCVGVSQARNTRNVSTGPNIFVGVETLTVGGEPVETYHYRQERVVSGDQDGTDVTEFWYTTDDALLVRLDRTTDVESPSPIGDVRYTETGRLTLRSLTPQR